MLKIKTTVTGMKNVFDGHISRLDMAKKRIDDPEDMSIATSKTEKQAEKKKKGGGRHLGGPVG